MTITRYRNTLIAAGIAAALGIGAVGCDKMPDNSSKDARAGGASQGITDTAITAGVKAKLAMDRNLDSSDISVSTANGTVTLTGSVSDTGSRSTAEAAASSFSGVNSVSNRLSVPTPSVAAAAKTTGQAAMAAGQAMSDTWITTKIKSVLLADSDAKGLDVSVDTKDGVVTLGGALKTQASVDHVKTLAGDVQGVKRIDAAALTVARL